MYIYFFDAQLLNFTACYQMQIRFKFYSGFYLCFFYHQIFTIRNYLYIQ